MSIVCWSINPSDGIAVVVVRFPASDVIFIESSEESVAAVDERAAGPRRATTDPVMRLATATVPVGEQIKPFFKNHIDFNVFLMPISFYNG